MDEIGDFAPSETGGFITVSYTYPLSDIFSGHFVAKLVHHFSPNLC
jgi:hypothetical protein